MAPPSDVIVETIWIPRDPVSGSFSRDTIRSGTVVGARKQHPQFFVCVLTVPLKYLSLFITPFIVEIKFLCVCLRAYSTHNMFAIIKK